MPLSRALLAGCCLLAGALAPAVVWAQTSDADVPLLHDCDFLVSHPDDPDRISPGVPDADLVPLLAVTVCENAVAEYPSVVRFSFQLGRALFAAGREEEALAQLSAAAKQDYAIAHLFLGDAYRFGLGLEADLMQARQHYQTALDSGFEGAAPLLAAVTFDADAFLIPMAAGINNGISELSTSLDLSTQPLLIAYVYSFAVAANSECRGRVRPANLMRLLELRFKGPVTPEMESGGDIQIYSSAGDYDAATFVARHGCDGAFPETFFENLNRYVALHRSSQ
ncbi:hypothetical protein SAMN06297251_101461 [Fulvimarina manganoxydans]|uniref:Sel1 repeat-containing protein n=1 Tax=Fulvimarina manganoxydans TaxID=937218 RepID=A0A1W1YM23_9HYPH|nr:hypothetical protein [Fulvimarina manganoxydans]SMC37176.1 hypothetical protein SAMN06297251_101461 [Fulvimarina manganoxydans]